MLRGCGPGALGSHGFSAFSLFASLLGFRALGIGSIWEYPLRFIENSAVFMADRIHTPVLMIQNDGDDAVPWYQGIELFLSLRCLGKEAYLFDYNGEAHGLRKRPNQKDYTVRMQQFFDHYLKGAPAPEWMEKGIPYIEREQEKQKIDAVYATTGSGQKK